MSIYEQVTLKSYPPVDGVEGRNDGRHWFSNDDRQPCTRMDRLIPNASERLLKMAHLARQPVRAKKGTLVQEDG